MLNWRTVTGSRNDKFMVRGTILSNAICGDNSRFLIEEVRCYRDGEADRFYRVRDAETVSDVDVRNGVGSKSIGTFDCEDDAVTYCMEQA